jgi:hypothetical protein
LDWVFFWLLLDLKLWVFSLCFVVFKKKKKTFFYWNRRLLLLKSVNVEVIYKKERSNISVFHGELLIGGKIGV